MGSSAELLAGDDLAELLAGDDLAELLGRAARPKTEVARQPIATDNDRSIESVIPDGSQIALHCHSPNARRTIVSHLRNCSWCGTLNQINYAVPVFCSKCQHRADASKDRCDCPRCPNFLLPAVTLSAELPEVSPVPTRNIVYDDLGQLPDLPDIDTVLAAEGLAELHTVTSASGLEVKFSLPEFPETVFQIFLTLDELKKHVVQIENIREHAPTWEVKTEGVQKPK